MTGNMIMEKTANRYLRPAPIFAFLCTVLLVISCQINEREQQEAFVDGEGISIEGAWARPAAAGRMSAGYFLITNFEQVNDTLTGVSSGAAELTEIHESYEQEGGMMGMREVPELEIPAGSTVSFEPGGLHIMFIQLTESLEEDDEVEITFHFANQDDLTVSLPVRQ